MTVLRSALPLVLLATTALVGVGYQPVAAKEANDFLVRGRVIVVAPEESGSTHPLGGDLDVSTNTAPELDFTYFITKNIATELILATTQHEVHLNNVSGLGNVSLGKTRVLPPTLLLQYHFFTDELMSPYLGAGLNYTIFWDETDGPVATNVDIENTIGYALQAGFDIQFPDSNFVFNVDVKKIFLSPDVDATVGGTHVKARNFDLNPWVIGTGFGYKF